MSEEKSKFYQNIMIALLVAIIILLFTFNYGSINQILFPPAPVIINYKSNDIPETAGNLLVNEIDNRVIVEAAIHNEGGDGDIVFEATVYQNGNSWTKTLKKYFDSQETSDMKLIFEEVNLLQGKIETSVKAYTDGK